MLFEGTLLLLLLLAVEPDIVAALLGSATPVLPSPKRGVGTGQGMHCPTTPPLSTMTDGVWQWGMCQLNQQLAGRDDALACCSDLLLGYVKQIHWASIQS